MIALGLVILVLAGITGAAGVLGNSGSDHVISNVSVFGAEFTGSSGRLILYGIAVGALGMLGLNMLLAGVGRGFKNRVRTHHEIRQSHLREDDLEEERRRLEQELSERRSMVDAVDLRVDATTAKPRRKLTSRKPRASTAAGGRKRAPGKTKE